MREVEIAERDGWFSRNPGQFNGHIGRLLGVQVEGNSFAELIHAYIGFGEAGHGVQFVSPESVAVPLACIDTSNREPSRDDYY